MMNEESVQRSSSLDALLQRVQATHNILADTERSQSSGGGNSDEDDAIDDILARMAVVEGLSPVPGRPGADNSYLDEAVSPTPDKKVKNKDKKSKKEKIAHSATIDKESPSKRSKKEKKDKEKKSKRDGSASPKEKSKKSKKENVEEDPDIHRAMVQQISSVSVETMLDKVAPLPVTRQELPSNASSRASSIASFASTGIGSLLSAPDEQPPQTADAGGTRFRHVETLEWVSSVMVWRYAGLPENPESIDDPSALPPVEDIADDRVFIYIPEALIEVADILGGILGGSDWNGATRATSRYVRRTLLHLNAALGYRAKYDAVRRRFYYLQLADKSFKGWRLPDLAKTALLQASFEPTVESGADESALWVRLVEACVDPLIRHRWERLQRTSYWCLVRCGSILEEAVSAVEKPPMVAVPLKQMEVHLPVQDALVEHANSTPLNSGSLTSSRRSSRRVSFTEELDDGVTIQNDEPIPYKVYDPPAETKANLSDVDVEAAHPAPDEGWSDPHVDQHEEPSLEPEARSSLTRPAPARSVSPPSAAPHPPPQPQHSDDYPFLASHRSSIIVQEEPKKSTIADRIVSSPLGRRIADLRKEMEEVVERAGHVPPPRSTIFVPSPDRKTPALPLPPAEVVSRTVSAPMSIQQWTSRTQLHYMMLLEDEKDRRQHVEDDALMFYLQEVKPLWRMACVEQKERFGRERLLIWELAEASKLFLYFSPTTAELITPIGGGGLGTSSVVSLTSTMNALMNFIYASSSSKNHRLQARYAGVESQKRIPQHNFKPGFFEAAPAFVPYVADKVDTIVAGRLQDADGPSSDLPLPVEYVRLHGTSLEGSPSPTRGRLLGQTSFQLKISAGTSNDAYLSVKHDPVPYFDRLYAPLYNPYPRRADGTSLDGEPLPILTRATNGSGSIQLPLAGISAVCFRSSLFLFLYSLWQDLKHEEVYSRGLLLRDALHDITGEYQGSGAPLSIRMNMSGAAGTPSSTGGSRRPSIDAVKPPLAPSTPLALRKEAPSSYSGTEYLSRQNINLEEAESRTAILKSMRQESDNLEFDVYWINKAVDAALTELELEELSRRARLLKSEGTIRDGIRAQSSESHSHLAYFESMLKTEKRLNSNLGLNGVARGLVLDLDDDVSPSSPYFQRASSSQDRRRNPSVSVRADSIQSLTPKQRLFVKDDVEVQRQLDERLEEEIATQLGRGAIPNATSGASFHMRKQHIAGTLTPKSGESWPLSAGYNVFIDRGPASPPSYQPYTPHSLLAPTPSITGPMVARAVEGAVRRFVADANTLFSKYQDEKVDLLSSSVAALTVAALQHRPLSRIDQLYTTSEETRSKSRVDDVSRNMRDASVAISLTSTTTRRRIALRDGPSLTDDHRDAAPSLPPQSSHATPSLSRVPSSSQHSRSASATNSVAEVYAVKDTERRERIKLWKEGKIGRLSAPLEESRHTPHLGTTAHPLPPHPARIHAKEQSVGNTTEGMYLSALAQKKREMASVVPVADQQRKDAELSELDLRKYANDTAHPFMEASPSRRRALGGASTSHRPETINARHYNDEVARLAHRDHLNASRVHQDRCTDRFVTTPSWGEKTNNTVPPRPVEESILRTRPHARALVLQEHRAQERSYKDPLEPGVAMWRQRLEATERVESKTAMHDAEHADHRRKKRLVSVLSQDSLIDVNTLRSNRWSAPAHESSSSSSTSRSSSSGSTHRSDLTSNSASIRSMSEVSSKASHDPHRRASRVSFPSSSHAPRRASTPRAAPTSTTSHTIHSIPDDRTPLSLVNSVSSLPQLDDDGSEAELYPTSRKKPTQKKPVVAKPRPKPTDAGSASPPLALMGFHAAQSPSPPSKQVSKKTTSTTNSVAKVSSPPASLVSSVASSTVKAASVICPSSPPVTSRVSSTAASTSACERPATSQQSKENTSNKASSAVSKTPSKSGSMPSRSPSAASELARKIRLGKKLRERGGSQTREPSQQPPVRAHPPDGVVAEPRVPSPGPRDPSPTGQVFERARSTATSIAMSMSTVRDHSPEEECGPSHSSQPHDTTARSTSVVYSVATPSANVSRVVSAPYEASPPPVHHVERSPVSSPRNVVLNDHSKIESSPLHHYNQHKSRNSAGRELSMGMESEAATILQWDHPAVLATYYDQFTEGRGSTGVLVPVEVSEGGVGLRRVEPPYMFEHTSHNSVEEVEETYRALCAFRKERGDILHNMKMTLVLEALGELNKAQGYDRDSTPSLSGPTQHLSFHTMGEEEQEEMVNWAGEQDEYINFEQEVDEEEASLVAAVAAVPPPRPLLSFGLGSVGVSSGLFIFEVMVRLVVTPARVQRFKEIRRAQSQATRRTGSALPSSAADVSFDELKQRPSKRSGSTTNNRSVTPQRSPQHSFRSPSSASDTSHRELYSPNPNRFPSSHNQPDPLPPTGSDPTFGRDGAPVAFAGYDDDGIDRILPFSMMCAVGFCTQGFRAEGKGSQGSQRGREPADELAAAYLLCEDGSLTLNANNSVVDIVRDSAAMDAAPKYFSRGHGFGDDFLHRARLSAPSTSNPSSLTHNHPNNRSLSALVSNNSTAASSTSRTTDTIQCTVTAILDLQAKELSYVVNGVPQGVAFQFNTGIDEDGEEGVVEPLFPLVILGEEGDEAWLVKPSV